ncbi:MAG TPA: calcium-binding protein [Solirubrobacterales bacterium]
MIRGSWLALAAACAALALPASSSAATVGVEELRTDQQTTDPQQSKLNFVGAAGEANRLTVSVAGEEGDFFDLQLVDTAAPIQPGPGCRGGGAAGTPVFCRAHKPTVGDFYSCWKGCYASPGTAWDLTLSFALGNAGSRLDTTALPGYVPNKEEFSPMAPVEVTVGPGAGDDTVLTGPGPDRIESSGGADLIRSGDGPDVLQGGPVADGPDEVDLGDAFEDTIDYSERSEGIRYQPNGQADDGATGEGDNLGAAGYVWGGAGGDALFSVRGKVLPYGAQITGGGGDDFLLGGRGSDSLTGGAGDDELVGGAGNDELMDPLYWGGGGKSGDDSAAGGRGHDKIELGRGEDEAAGGPGRDQIVLGPDGDTATGGGGNDLLMGEGGRDEIEAGPGNDRLSGDAGRDWLFGGGGDDRIAAGMVVLRVWGYRTFLHSMGPLEGRPDEVGCGTGRDKARAGIGDTAAGCEAVLRAEPLEVRGFADGDRYFPPRIKLSIRRPGTVRLEGKGLMPKTRSVRRSYGVLTLALRPDKRARRLLLRDGHVELRLRISYRAVDGREVARIYPIDLWQRGEIKSGAPA